MVKKLEQNIARDSKYIEQHAVVSLWLCNTCNKKDKSDQIAHNYVVELCSNNPSLTM